MTTPRTRVALIGLGNAGYTLHLPALSELPAEVVAAFDPDKERRERAAAKFRVPVVDRVEALFDARPDAVIVASPPDSHAAYTHQALSAGAHVFCEKPFVSARDQADAIIAEAAERRLQVAVNHEFRHMPIFRRLIDSVASEGELRFVQVWQLMNLAPWMEPGWRGQMLQRTLYEAGVHLVDLVIALFGEKPIAVSGTMSSCAAIDRDSDAVALVTLEFSRGRLAQIVQNRLCKGATQYVEVRADTASGSWRASFGGRARLLAGLFRSTRPSVRLEYGLAGMSWREEGNTRRFLARNPSDPGMRATREALRLSLEAFAKGGPPPTSAADARDIHDVITACYHAAATGRRITIDSDELRTLNGWRLGAPPAV